jgi:hypothetical protein
MSPAGLSRADLEALGPGPGADEVLDRGFDEAKKELGAGPAPQEDFSEFESLAGERGASALHRSRSLQSRASHVLALSLMGALAVGLFGWYYFHTFASRGTAQRTAQAASRSQAAGDAPLPSLGPITLPEVPVEKILGPAPDERLPNWPWIGGSPGPPSRDAATAIRRRRSRRAQARARPL